MSAQLQHKYGRELGGTTGTELLKTKGREHLSRQRMRHESFLEAAEVLPLRPSPLGPAWRTQ